MASASFTRDEVILSLDVLYSSSERLTPESDEIVSLCGLLQRLPIHPLDNRRTDFRNHTGVNRQIALFKSSCKTGRRDPNVGQMFFTVAYEFENDLDRLHSIAESIRKNERHFTSRFGADSEGESFPEGILLGHLHRVIERRDGQKALLAKRCSICQIEPEGLYQPCGQLLEQHLVVDPVDLDGNQRYKQDDFITVCPNCHAALHKYRPWLTRETSEGLLRG